MDLPDIDNEEDILASLTFKDESKLTKDEIKKIIKVFNTTSQDKLLELSGLLNKIGPKKTIKYLEDNKEKEFIDLIKNSSPFGESRRKYFLNMTASLRSLANMVEGIYKCARCGSKKVKTIQKQTRSSDEPTTEFNSCVCGHNWVT
jgi:DNA-directed RNA polymerase subunit M/transcription elongation factor TFIIS